ncbi:MAG: DUF790 family protein [Candidatus Bathyarchaeota archaeon]
MLPSELLSVRRRKGEIQPRYVTLSSENLEIAQLLIQKYHSYVGEKKKTIKEYVSEIEDSGYDYRFIRGLSTLLDRRSIFKCDIKFDPAELRRRLYITSNKVGIPTTTEQRSRIIESVASEMKISPNEVEESFYADLDAELVLKEFVPLQPQELLKEYNLSLTQTLLFSSTELDFTVSGNWQRIFYNIKRLGLIYEARRNENTWVKIDGPVSLFKLTNRYGTSLAKLLPIIIHNPDWIIKAKILWKYTNRIYSFEAKSQTHAKMLRKLETEPVKYDSMVERDFATRFQALKSRWILRREPEPLPAGKYVMIPDFTFERGDIKIYMEVAGFWTTEYLKRKIMKLQKIDVNMIIAADEDLMCEELSKLDKGERFNIIYYKKKIPLPPILGHLEKAFKHVEKHQIDIVRNLPVKFVEQVIDYEELAQRIGVSVESVRVALTDKPPAGYRVLPNSMVKNTKLEEISKIIEEKKEQTERLTLTEAEEILRTEGLKDVSNILRTLGYKIVWRGINPEAAEIIKVNE